jgi:hypothetical protein
MPGPTIWVHLLYFTNLHGDTNRGVQIQGELLRLTSPFLLQEGGDSTGTHLLTLIIIQGAPYTA